MTLSDQALTCIMIALQKSLMEQSDIVPTLKGFIFSELSLDGNKFLVVNNPPSQIVVQQGKFVSE